jgi:hypothetical protein
MARRRLMSAFVFGSVLALTIASTAFAAHPAWRTGQGGIQPTWAMDLDNGTFNTLSGGDIYLDVYDETMRWLSNTSDGQILRMSSRPTYSQCAHATLGSHEYKTSRNVGRWFCVRTDQDRFARVEILKNHIGGNLDIKFLTWCDFGDACVA